MYADKLLRPYVLRENHFTQVTPLETKTITVKSDGTKPNIVPKPDGEIFLIFLGFSMVLGIVFLMFPSLRKVTRERTGTIKHIDRVPCKSCRYFTDSPYLKCAVHPDIALTKRSLDCPDYCNSRVRSNARK